jgi:acyl-coenzyme A thioesterase PaaI-like protein
VTSPDFDSISKGLQEAVPFVRTLGLEYLELDTTRAVLRLPDEPAHHNHVGGPHAGAMFSLGESASGAVVLAAFMGVLDRATPLAVRADIAYRKLAMGAVVAEAVMEGTPEDVLARLNAGERPEFPVNVELRTEDGTVTGTMSVTWTLKPNRR